MSSNEEIAKLEEQLHQVQADKARQDAEVKVEVEDKVAEERQVAEEKAAVEAKRIIEEWAVAEVEGGKGDSHEGPTACGGEGGSSSSCKIEDHLGGGPGQAQG